VAPAQRFGYATHKGKLVPGQDADLVVLDTDPAKDITAFAKVRLTIRSGRIIFDANDKTRSVLRGETAKLSNAILLSFNWSGKHPAGHLRFRRHAACYFSEIQAEIL
jgi:adenine deaminase